MSSDGFRSLQRVRERAAAAASNSSLSSGQPPLPAASLASGSPDAAEARLEALSRLQTSHLKASTDRLLEWARSTAEDLAFASTSSPATMPATLPATIPASLPAQAGGAGIVSSPYALGADLAALGLFGDARRPSRDEFREADIADAEDLPVWPVSAGTTAPGSLGRPRAKTTTVATTAVLASQDARSLRSSSPTRSVTLSDVSEDGTAASADLFDDAARSHSPLNNSKLYISISDSDAARSHVLPPPPATSVHAASAVPRLLSALGSGESQTADKQLVAASSATSLRLDSQSSLTLPSVTEMEANLPLLISRALEQHRAILSTAMKVYDVSIQFTEINQALLGEAAHVKTLQDACDEQVQQLAQMRFEYRFRRQELDQLGATSTMVNVLADLSMLFQGCTSMEREFADTREEYETMLQRLEKEGILDPASDSASPVAQAGGSFLPDMDSSSAMMLVGNNASQQGLLQRQWSESETDFVLRRKYDKMLHTVRLNDDRLRRLHETIEQQLPRNRLMMSVLPLLRGFGSRYSSWIQDARLMALEIKQELDKILLIRERTPAQRRVKRRATWTDGGPRANVTELLSRRSSWRNDVAADSPVSPVRAISPSRLAEPHSPAELKSQPRTESAETRTEAGDFVPLDLAFDGLFDKTPIVAQSKQRSGLLGFVQRAVLTALDLVRAVVESL
ncbi:hypothetical protein HK105_205493 [Polyrhizophydium stewartii]|uniref:Uncharacterized protein n=1 Tax=Polyrhizophydium stewartii TaxID=2732419 RepID=A0ABR4N610_9FUNG